MQFIYARLRPEEGDDGDDEMMFEFYPNEFLLFPLVDADLRVTYCDNSIWNLKNQTFTEEEMMNYEDKIDKRSAEDLGFGLVFMRKYGMKIIYSGGLASYYS